MVGVEHSIVETGREIQFARAVKLYDYFGKLYGAGFCIRSNVQCIQELLPELTEQGKVSKKLKAYSSIVCYKHSIVANNLEDSLQNLGIKILHQKISTEEFSHVLVFETKHLNLARLSLQKDKTGYQFCNYADLYYMLKKNNANGLFQF